MPRVLNKHLHVVPDDAVNIMRGTPWGNPFVIGRDGNRDEVCDKFERNLSDALIERAQRELRGRDLVCCCTPQRCHGDTLLFVANLQ